MERRGRRASRDEGFSLVEVILAMVIIVGVLATMLGFVVSSLTTIAQGRQRQTATALATQAMEEMRALPYDTITLNHAGDTPDATATYAVAESGGYFLRATLPNLSLNEVLIVNDVSGRTRTETVDEVSYRVHRYVTVGPNDSFNLTVIVAYTSGVSRGQRVTVQRSVAFSPTGCLSTAQNPFAAPCQAYFTANAGTAHGGFSVVNPIDATQPILGFANSGGTLLELGLPSTSASVLVEQTASAMATATTSGAAQTSTVAGSSGSVTADVGLDSDPSSVPGQWDIKTTAGQTSSTQSLSGVAGSLTATPGTGDTGRAAGGIFAQGTHCVGPTNNALATGPDADHLRPCASSHVLGNTSPATLNYLPNSPGGFSSMTIPIVSIDDVSSPARAVAAQLAHLPGANPNANACTAGAGPTGNGCAYAAARRELGELYVGYSPTGAVGPAGMNEGVVHLSGMTEEVLAEEGAGGRAPTYTRGGVLRVWNGTTYAQVALSSTSSASIPVDAQIVYSSPSGKQLTLHYTGQVTVNAAQLVRTPATRTGDLVDDCQDQPCVSQYNGGSSVAISLTVSVLEGGAELASFGVAGDLGGLVGQATYKEAADAT